MRAHLRVRSFRVIYRYISFAAAVFAHYNFAAALFCFIYVILAVVALAFICAENGLLICNIRSVYNVLYAGVLIRAVLQNGNAR